MRLLHLFGSLKVGGTERVVVSRAQLAKRLGAPLLIDLHVPDASTDDIAAFERSVFAFGLKDHLRLVPSLAPSGYDAVLVMDFPEMFDRLRDAGSPVIAEAHQPRELQEYLRDLPAFVRVAATPSVSHADVVRDLVAPHVSLRVIPNVVIGSRPSASRTPSDSGGPRLLFSGRMGAVKDTPELVRVFAGVLAAEPAAAPVIVTPTVSHGATEAALDEVGLRGRVEVNRSVGFHSMGPVLDEVRASRGVFVSCSRTESFGLAAAEAIVAGVPVVLSDIPSHRALLASTGRKEDALFPLGETAGAVARILKTLREWDAARSHQAPAAAPLCDERGGLAALLDVVAEAKRLQR